jgi:hypothetical protein
VISRIVRSYAALRWRTLALIGGVALTAAVLLVLSRPIVMLVDGERVDSDVAPITTANAHVYVPLRSIADALGAETEVDTKTGKISVTLGGQTLTLRVGDSHARVNGMPLTLRRPPFRVRGRVMVSLEAVAHALNVRAKYDEHNARIEVNTPGIGMAPNSVSPETH